MKTLRSLLTGAAALALAFVLASCGESPVAPPAAATITAAPQTDAELLELLAKPIGSLGLIKCSPLKSDFEGEWVGTAGGRIDVGPHRLVIPSGALKRWTYITAEIESDKVNRVHFEPHGLEFEKQPTLTMSYANCGLFGALLPGHIAYTNDDLVVLELLNAVPNVLRHPSP